MLIIVGNWDAGESLYLQLLEAVDEENDKLDVTIGLGLLYNETKGSAGACEVLLTP
jgi:hypothetical protein